jgi:hypothetical protein
MVQLVVPPWPVSEVITLPIESREPTVNMCYC